MLPLLRKQAINIYKKELIEFCPATRWNTYNSMFIPGGNLYQMSNDKNKNQGGQENQKQLNQKGKSKTPKIIQISKQQLYSMKKFMQDIRLSMPMPNITPPDMSSSKKVSSPTMSAPDTASQQNKTNGQQVKNTEYVNDYFSSPEHILSFKLLKLSEPVQFSSVFQQNKASQEEFSTKLLILHRFVSVGGIVSKNAGSKLGSNVCKLAYEYISDILKNMKRLQQNELQQFLQIYLTLHKQQEEEEGLQQKHSVGSIQQSKLSSASTQVPVLDVQQITEEELPLVENPTHRNSRVLVLLLQLWQLNTSKGLQQGKVQPISKSARQGMVRILNHYQLAEENDSENEQMDENEQEQSRQSLKYLAYIGICAYMCGMEQYNAIPMLIRSLRSTKQIKSNKELVQCAQCVLHQCHLLAACSSPIMKEMNQLKLTLIEVVQKLCNNADQSQDMIKGADKQQQMLRMNTQSGSGTVSALLHSSLLSLQHNLSNISVDMGAAISSTILNTLSKTRTSKSLSIEQYSEYWRSAMIMYKLLKRKTRSMHQSQLYKLVDVFINRTDVGGLARDATTTVEGEYVIQELVEKMEAMLFDCLVAYRMILNPQLNEATLSKHETSRQQHQEEYTNIRNQIVAEKQNIKDIHIHTQSRQVLKQLLKGYRQVCETMIRCGLVESPQDSVIHNMIIACMIAQAYTNGQHSYIGYILSPTIRHALNQHGVAHAKYGQYVRKLLQKHPVQQLG